MGHGITQYKKGGDDVKMVPSELRELIICNLKIFLIEEDWKYIDDMFSECYYTYEDGLERITLKPQPLGGDVAMQFSPLNGSYIGVADWYTIQKVGELI